MQSSHDCATCGICQVDDSELCSVTLARAAVHALVGKYGNEIGVDFNDILPCDMLNVTQVRGPNHGSLGPLKVL